ncbi:hypothetical protein NW768_002794 [Fusarium equiseti]|uniref:Uncharacterized protein n=1 Tax=Fusarium equiseti TaxID=61235 RepID=A0ABQ8RK97_FUSEQ|nr:hypothetical protein NW768_002794 [Fusarium equiseti]
MKNVNAFLLALAYAAMASSAATPVSPGAAAVCGDLGILNIAPGDLPEGVEPSELRLCADHPMGRNRTLDPAEGASLAPMTEEEDLEPDTTPAAGASLFEERACYYKAPVVESQEVDNGVGLLQLQVVVRGTDATSLKIAAQTGSLKLVETAVGSRARAVAAARDS